MSPVCRTIPGDEAVLIGRQGDRRNHRAGTRRKGRHHPIRNLHRPRATRGAFVCRMTDHDIYTRFALALKFKSYGARPPPRKIFSRIRKPRFWCGEITFCLPRSLMRGSCIVLLAIVMVLCPPSCTTVQVPYAPGVSFECRLSVWPTFDSPFEFLIQRDSSGRATLTEFCTRSRWLLAEEEWCADRSHDRLETVGKLHEVSARARPLVDTFEAALHDRTGWHYHDTGTTRWGSLSPSSSLDTFRAPVRERFVEFTTDIVSILPEA